MAVRRLCCLALRSRGTKCGQRFYGTAPCGLPLFRSLFRPPSVIKVWRRLIERFEERQDSSCMNERTER